MATLAGTTAGFKPYSSHGSGGQSGHSIVDMPVASGQTIAEGDVVTMSGGVVSTENDAAVLIVGVATQTMTVASTGLDSDKVPVALALPGALFSGTFATAAATDITDPAFADITQAAAGKDIAEHADGHPIIIDATTNDVCYLIAFANEQFKGVDFVSGSGGTTNPRVIFQFNTGETIFEPTSA